MKTLGCSDNPLVIGANCSTMNIPINTDMYTNIESRNNCFSGLFSFNTTLISINLNKKYRQATIVLLRNEPIIFIMYIHTDILPFIRINN